MIPGMKNCLVQAVAVEACTVDMRAFLALLRKKPIRARITRRDKPGASGPQRPIVTCQHVGLEQGVGDGVGHHRVSEEALMIEGGGGENQFPRRFRPAIGRSRTPKKG